MLVAKQGAICVREDVRSGAKLERRLAPYVNTARLAASLGVGVVLTWKGQGHTAYLKSDCIDTAVDAYLVSGTVPKKGTTCPA